MEEGDPCLVMMLSCLAHYSCMDRCQSFVGMSCHSFKVDHSEDKILSLWMLMLVSFGLSLHQTTASGDPWIGDVAVLSRSLSLPWIGIRALFGFVLSFLKVDQWIEC